MTKHPHERPTWFQTSRDPNAFAGAMTCFEAIGFDPETVFRRMRATIEKGKPLSPEPDAQGFPMAEGRYIVGPPVPPHDFLAVIQEGSPATVVNFVPLLQTGIHVTGEYVESIVSPSEVEAATTISLEGMLVSFYDTGFCLHRHRYREGWVARWRISGLALDLGPGGEEDLASERLPKEATDVLGRPVDLSQIRVYLPVNEPGDVADVRGAFSHVLASGYLGLPVWQTILGLPLGEDGTLALPVLLGEPAWTGRDPPRAHSFAEGRLWLQGCFEPSD